MDAVTTTVFVSEQKLSTSALEMNSAKEMNFSTFIPRVLMFSKCKRWCYFLFLLQIKRFITIVTLHVTFVDFSF